MLTRLTRASRIAWWGLSLFVLALVAWPGFTFVDDDAKFVKVNQIFGVNQPEIFVENEFIVVLTREASRNIVAGQDRFGMLTVSVPSLQDVIDRNGVTRFARLFPTAKPRSVDSKYPDLTGHYKVKIDAGIDLDAAMAAFARDPRVDHVEKIGIHPVYSCATGTPLSPNDTWFDNPPPEFNFPQWDLWDANGIDADLAWSINTGDETVVVVAMDTGVRYFHRDLGGNNPPGPGDNVTNGNVWVNPFEIPNNGVDDEGNGKVDDVVGWDFVTGVTGCSSGEDCSTQDNDPRDFDGHGTHTAGTMASITNNARGVAGIAGGFGDGTTGSPGNGSKIMCMRIGWSTPNGGFVRMDFAAEAMTYVADMKNRGVNIAAVNASWGSSNSGGIDAAVDNLLAADVMLIHAAGNSNANSPDFLGNKAGVVNVAATDKNGNKASFSNFGAWVDIAAPGVDIISTYHLSSDPANDYVAVLNGTSMSAPHVTGMAGLLESCDNGLSGPDKLNIMVNNACPAGSSNIGDILNAKLSLDTIPGVCGACIIDAECDDGNPCTADICDPPGLCSNNPIALCCGNGTCESGEDCNICPSDCSSGSGAVCGNGICEVADGEDCLGCPQDCNGVQTGPPFERFCCGQDVTCTDSRCTSSGFACTEESTIPFCCGDVVCEGSEDIGNCEIDCSLPAGSVPNGKDIPGIPLTVTLTAVGEVTLSWDGSCSSTDTDFEIYEGTLGDFASHTARFCSTGGATTITFVPGNENSYYLVVPRNALREGSYGLRSDGTDRLPGVAVCLPQKIALCL